MTFEGQYLTKVEYIALGGNPQIEDMPFNLLEFEARKQIDSRTKNRLKKAQVIPQEVKICDFKLIEAIQKYNNENDRTKKSETVGSYSVTYQDIAQIMSDKQDEFYNLITDELYGVIVNGEHVIYLGGI